MGKRIVVCFFCTWNNADSNEAERRRMALSIHDGLAQVAASVCQQLEIIAHRFDPSCDDENRERNTQAAVRYCLEHPQWRLGLQTHKLLGIA